MGLDANMYKIPADFIKDQPWADVELEDSGDLVELKYWRKHGQLQNWMHNRYNNYNGKTDDFNCVYVRLFEHDFEKLLQDLKSGNIPSGRGFFYGDDDQEKIDDDIAYFTELMGELNFKKWAYLYQAWY